MENMSTEEAKQYAEDLYNSIKAEPKKLNDTQALNIILHYLRNTFNFRVLTSRL